MILVNGMILDQPTIVNSLNDSPAWSSYSIENARLIPSGDNSAILVYEATAHRDGEDGPFTALMSSHYSIADGRPVLMLYQQTTVTH